MTRRRIIFTVIALLLITTTIVTLEWPSSDPSLDIGLRCDEGVSGTLSVTTLLPDSDEWQVEESFDVEAACEKMILKFSHYRGWENVLFTLKRDSDETTRLISEYGPDIEVDNHHGFVVVIEILNAPPFLANDGI